MPPAALAHYRILRPLAAGGMGEVYLAEDTKLGRRVALKVLPPSLADNPERRDRFEREARAVAALNHPNITTLHSIEQDGGVLFLTMEFVEGKTLSELIPRGGMTIGHLLHLAIPLVDAIAAAHERKVTHRDLKPANVMVTSDGRVKVLDFGLAKVEQEAPLAGDATMTARPITRDGLIMGTFAYMSPEQAQGRPVDSRSDIFSLGILLYEMATGERPFKGDTHLSVLSSILRDTPPPLTQVRADLPRDVGRIVRRCLAKDPEERYQSAKDLRNDLRLLKADLDSGSLEHEGTDPGRTGIATPRSGHRWNATRLGAAAIVVGLIALGAGWWYSRRPVRAPALPLESIAMKRLTNTGDASLAAISPDGRYVVHVVGARGKPSLWVRQVSSASNVQIVPPMPGSYGALTFSPDGENVLYVFYPPNTFGSLFELPLLGGLPRKIVDDLDTTPAFSPDGQRMAFVRDLGSGGRAIVLSTRDGGNQQQLAVGTTPNEYAPVQMAWSADGRELATFVGSMPRGLSRLVLVDVATGRPRDLSDARFDFPGQLSWLPEGRTLVFDAVGQGQGYGSSGQLWSISYPDGALRRLTADVANYSRLAAARDGRTFVAVQHAIRGNLWVAPEGDTSRARSITNVTAGGDGTVGIDWTYDGRIVYGAMAHDSWDLWIANADGSAARQLTSAPGVEAVPCVLPGGRSVAYISRSLGESRFRIRAVDLDGSNDRELLSTDVQPGYLQAVGDQLYFWVLAGRGVVAHRMPLAGGTPLPVFADPPKLPPNFRLRGVSPDGQWAFGTTLDLHVPGVNLAVLSIAGTRPRRIFPLPTERHPLDLVLSWAPRADAVEAVVSRDGIGNLWRFPLDGSPPVPVTRFESDDIRSYAWSHDGRTLALSRGSQSSDVVLITLGR